MASVSYICEHKYKLQNGNSAGLTQAYIVICFVTSTCNVSVHSNAGLFGGGGGFDMIHVYIMHGSGSL